MKLSPRKHSKAIFWARASGAVPFGLAALQFSAWYEKRALGRKPVFAPQRIAERLLEKWAHLRTPRRLGPGMGWSLQLVYASGLCLLAAGVPWLRTSALRRTLALAGAVLALERVLLPLSRATPPWETWSKAEQRLWVLHVLLFSGAAGVGGRLQHPV